MRRRNHDDGALTSPRRGTGWTRQLSNLGSDVEPACGRSVLSAGRSQRKRSDPNDLIEAWHMNVVKRSQPNYGRSAAVRSITTFNPSSTGASSVCTRKAAFCRMQRRKRLCDTRVTEYGRCCFHNAHFLRSPRRPLQEAGSCGKSFNESSPRSNREDIQIFQNASTHQ